MDTSSTLTVTTEADGTLALQGPLNFDTVRAVLAQTTSALASAVHPCIDLSGITRTDSAGLALLVEWVKCARTKQQPLVLRGVPSQLTALAAACGVTPLLNDPT